MIEETQQVVPLQGFLIVTLVDVQHSVLSIKIGEFKTFLSIAKENQVKTQARDEGEADMLHCSLK